MANYGWYVDLQGSAFADTVPSQTSPEGSVSKWIDLMRVGKYKHAIYGDIDFTAEKLQQFADNVDNNVRGIELDIDYDHKQDPAKGSMAAGWIKKAKFENGVLRGLVEFTKSAVQAIKEGAYRYFSPEFHDEWVDAQGVSHKNVLFGGGITNRPFLKDLLPINLSELQFGDPTQIDKKENEVDPKQLRASVGLAEGATDAEVDARLALIKQLAEAFPSGPPKVETPPAPPAPPALPAPVLKLNEDLKALAESNPTVKALVTHMEDQIRFNAQQAVQLREMEVAQKLAEFDASKITLTPVARDLVREIMMSEDIKPEMTAKIWALLAQMKTGQSFYVELGERAGLSFQYGGSNKSAADQFRALTETLVAGGMTYADANEKVAKDNPALYEQYRNESFAFHE